MKGIFAAMMLGLAISAHAEWSLSFRKIVAALPGGAEFVELEVSQNGGAVRVQGVYFTPKQARLAVIDNPGGRISLRDAMTSAGALAGTNGAYFQADWTPVGLEIADGTKVHGFEKAKLLSGVFVVTKGVPRIVRSGAYTASKNDTQALQCGPFLIENGQTVAGLNSARAARRTVVATDGKGRWALLLFSRVTLADTGAMLASRAVLPDFRVATALNLDGGSSSALWVATAPTPFYFPEWGRVRNFLAILPR